MEGQPNRSYPYAGGHNESYPPRPDTNHPNPATAGGAPVAGYRGDARPGMPGGAYYGSAPYPVQQQAGQAAQQPHAVGEYARQPYAGAPGQPVVPQRYPAGHYPPTVGYAAPGGGAVPPRGGAAGAGVAGGLMPARGGYDPRQQPQPQRPSAQPSHPGYYASPSQQQQQHGQMPPGAMRGGAGAAAAAPMRYDPSTAAMMRPAGPHPSSQAHPAQQPPFPHGQPHPSQMGYDGSHAYGAMQPHYPGYGRGGAVGYYAGAGGGGYAPVPGRPGQPYPPHPQQQGPPHGYAGHPYSGANHAPGVRYAHSPPHHDYPPQHDVGSYLTHYGSGGGGRGNYAMRGGRGGGSWRSGRGGGGAYNGSGSAAGGGSAHMSAGGRHDVYHLVHIDNFAALEQVRSGKTLEGGVVEESVLTQMRGRARGGTLRVLTIVAKQYLAGCISLSRLSNANHANNSHSYTNSEDVMLLESTARKFLDIAAVLNDDGTRLVDAPSGAHVAKHVYLQMRSHLTQLASYDSQSGSVGGSGSNESAESTSNTAGQDEEAETGKAAGLPVDVYAMAVSDLLKEMVRRRAVFEALAAALHEDTPRAAALLIALVTAQDIKTTSPAGTSAPGGGAQRNSESEEGGISDNTNNNDEDHSGNTGNDESENNGNHTNSNKEDEQASAELSGQNAAGGSTRSASTGTGEVKLLSSAQGIYLLTTALQQSAKREAFFALLRRSTTPHLFTTLFCSTLTARVVMDCFDVEVQSAANLPAAAGGARSHQRVFAVRPAASSATARSAEVRQREREVLCDCFARFGIDVVCGNGGSSLLTALVRAMRPNFPVYDSSSAVAAGATGAEGGRRGQKRGRAEAAAGQEAEEEQQPQRKTAFSESQHSTSANGATASSSAATTNSSNHNTTTHAANSLQDYVIIAPPTHWGLFYAAISAFTSGDITTMSGSEKNASDKNAEGETGKESELSRRVRLLSQHVVGCRAVQILLPHFADALLAQAKSEADRSQPAWPLSVAAPAGPGEDYSPARHAIYLSQCAALLQEVSTRAKELMVHNYGNYVAQTLITEFAPRAVPGTPVEQAIRTVLDIIVNNIFVIGVQKFASNCAERAIVASQGMNDGHEFILRMVRAVLERGDTVMLEVASNQFGNYVVRHLCERLTAMVTGKVKDVSSEVRRDAAALELRMYKALRARMGQLQYTQYGVGLMAWMHLQQSRLDAGANSARV